MSLRTTPSATKETLFTLAFGHEAMIPSEIEVNILRVSMYDANDNDEIIGVNLNLIDGIRNEAQVRAATRCQ